MQRLSISKGHAFILVFSVTSKQSLEEVRPILDAIREVKGTEADETPVMLVGNKVDEEGQREVSTELGQLVAKRWGTGYSETSAKLDLNVKEMFQELLSMEKRRTLSLNPETDKKGKKKKESKKDSKDSKAPADKGGDKKTKSEPKAKGKCVVM